MNIELTEGCVSDSLTIDGVEECKLTDEQRQDYLNRVLDSLKSFFKPNDLNTFLQYLCRTHGEWETTDTPCPQCGDFIDTYRLNLTENKKVSIDTDVPYRLCYG